MENERYFYLMTIDIIEYMNIIECYKIYICGKYI